MEGKTKILWLGLWLRSGASGDPGAPINHLIECYSEPHRAYHTLAHIESCLAEFASVRSLASDPEAVEWCLWYHDAIYNTRARDNEERSADLAGKVMDEAELNRVFIRKVQGFILATKHTALPILFDSQLLVDIDLAVLGQSENTFDEYERQIRQEYGWVSEDAFIAGRTAILLSFLARPTIYATDFFRNKYEERAQRNLARSLVKLLSNERNP